MAEALAHPILSPFVMPAGRTDASAGQKISTETGKAPDKPAVPTLGKTVRLRDKEHRKFVSRQPCLVCGRNPSDPHHLRFVQPYALGRRVSDEFTVPLCRVHHRDLHRHGDEAAWWGKLSIDPVPLALTLWQHTRVNGTATAMKPSQQGPAGTALDPDIDARSSVCKTVAGGARQ
jgi:hypothetical protein